MNKKASDLCDFQSWVVAIDLGGEVYSVTQKFPKDEMYGMTNQIRRAVVSVSANLAEGYGRQTQKDKDNFYVIARGSLYEVRSLMELSKRVGYLSEDDFEKINESINKCSNYIGALITAHRSKK